MKVAVLLVSVLALAYGDIYMHNPRGSNNRLDEQNANRNNANRVFDSQNNERGGYNIGDRTDNAAGNDEDDQYHMMHFMSAPDYKRKNGQTSSYLDIEWTNQHGCGGTTGANKQENTFCQVVIQYLCRPESVDDVDKVRDGTSTQTNEHHGGHGDESPSAFARRKKDKAREDRAMHESFEWYDKCYKRRRNQGLFAADQNISQRSARGTRQNPNGQRRGYECPEERDYYPYWHPTEWKDIAVMAENVTMCRNHYQKHSFNVRKKHECMEKYRNSDEYKHWSEHNNKQDCVSRGGEWLEFYNYLERAPQYTNSRDCTKASGNGIRYIWKRAMGDRRQSCLVALDKPDCVTAPWSRDNHLGNTKDGQAMRYRWQIPYFPSGEQQRCVVRLRYNISTYDYHPYKTDAAFNKNGPKGPVIENDPEIDMGIGRVELQLAINTAQTGRTFQDRSHYMVLQKRPPGTDAFRIHNLNVRGKRGNIVQVYPAVEYDFVPTDLKMNGDKDLVHIQWTGSNTHNNNGEGDDGEGTGGTDRNNMVQITNRNDNYPILLKDGDEKETLFSGATVYWEANRGGDHTKDDLNKKPLDIAIRAATAGYVECEDDCSRSSRRKKMQDQMNNADASFPGMLLKLSKGKYDYMCTRNNNFSNRSQKGSITVA